MKKLVLVFALAATPLIAHAGDKLSYSYIEADWARQSLDLGGRPEPGVTLTMDDPDLDGFALNGSVELGETFYLLGGYRRGNDDAQVQVRVETVSGPFFGEWDVEIDGDQFNVGLGYHHGLSENADFLAELSYIGTQIDVDGYEAADGDDLRAAVGFRGAFSDHVEGWAKANYTDGDVYDGEFSATVGAQVKFNATWGVVGEVELGDLFTQYQIGVRASF